MKAVPASRYVVFFSVMIVGFAVDLATKSWIFNRLGLPGGPTWWLIEDFIGFQTSLNEGALFGMGQGMVSFFALMSIGAAIAIFVWLFVFGAAADWLLTVSLGCVTAGTFGNLYDRLGMPGLRWNYANALHEFDQPVHAVRDWILVMIGSWPWPTFNVADSLLVVGAALLVLHAVRHDPNDKAEQATKKAE